MSPPPPPRVIHLTPCRPPHPPNINTPKRQIPEPNIVFAIFLGARASGVDSSMEKQIIFIILKVAYTFNTSLVRFVPSLDYRFLSRILQFYAQSRAAHASHFIVSISPGRAELVPNPDPWNPEGSFVGAEKPSA